MLPRRLRRVIFLRFHVHVDFLRVIPQRYADDAAAPMPR